MSINEEVILTDIQVQLNPAELHDQPPFTSWASSNTREAMRNAIERLAPSVSNAFSPQGIYRLTPIEESQIFQYDPPDDIVTAEYVIPGVLTLGEMATDTEKPAEKLDKLIWDALENAVLLNAREQLLEAVKDECEDRGFNLTQVHAPGAKDRSWSLENREYMFETLPTEKVGVRLLENGNTDPPKTFTFAMGAGPNVAQADILVSCADCPYAEDCFYAGAATVA